MYVYRHIKSARDRSNTRERECVDSERERDRHLGTYPDMRYNFGVEFDTFHTADLRPNAGIEFCKVIRFSLFTVNLSLTQIRKKTPYAYYKGLVNP